MEMCSNHSSFLSASLYFILWDSSLRYQVKLTIESDISMSTQEVVQTLRAESSENHLAILGGIQTMSGQVSQSVGTELEQKLPLLEDNLSQKIDNSRRLIESTMSQSSAAVSQSVVAEMNQRLPVLEGSVVSS